MSERPKQDRGLTRRGLFRSIGTATIVAGCAKPELSAETPDQPEAPDVDGAFGLTPAPLEFVLDGEPVKTQAAAHTTLLELLRLDLDRTGTKVVCDRGACGACMVLVDGVPRNSCMLLAHDAAGAEITTVAGLAASGELSALQQAFVEHDALQCGFCTSGMLITTSALLRRREGAPLTRAEVEDAIAGNLCRCGTYPHVVDAVVSVATGEPGRQHRAELIPARKLGKKGGA
jgi:xanthine dehydrogenase YagT iron-sulfur-binding subunit